jgi:hypothetical protein
LSRHLLVPRQFRDARAYGGSGVAREEHRRQKQSQVPHPSESHVYPRLLRPGQLAYPNTSANQAMLPA